jgi:hypothetical protein
MFKRIQIIFKFCVNEVTLLDYLPELIENIDQFKLAVDLKEVWEYIMEKFISGFLIVSMLLGQLACGKKDDRRRLEQLENSVIAQNIMLNTVVDMRKEASNRFYLVFIGMILSTLIFIWRDRDMNKNISSLISNTNENISSLISKVDDIVPNVNNTIYAKFQEIKDIIKNKNRPLKEKVSRICDDLINVINSLGFIKGQKQLILNIVQASQPLQASQPPQPSQPAGSNEE